MIFLLSFKTVVKKQTNHRYSRRRHVLKSTLTHSNKWGNAKIVIQVKCTMLLNEHILIAQDPWGNKLHSHSKHSGFIYWPWRVLFIQIEIKTAKRNKIIPWFNLPSWNKQITQGEYYFACYWDNEHYSTDRTAYIFTAWLHRKALILETK